jgi:hypothetical protein
MRRIALAVALMVTLAGFVAPAGAVAAPGATWTIVPSPNPGHGVFNALFSSVSATSATDAWAVGFDDYPDAVGKTLAEHWNGNGWEVVHTPNRGDFENELLGVAAIAPDDVWAVGETTDPDRGVTGTLAMHFDGSSWQIVRTPNVSIEFGHSNTLTSITAIASDDIWAAGWAITRGGNGIKMIFEHWDGTAWRMEPSPSPAGTFQFAVGIDAVSSDDIWAVGYDETRSPLRTLTAHWNGRSWRIVPSPNLGDGSPPDNKLASVVAVGHSDVWAVGWEDGIDGTNRQRTLTEHWNGRAWKIIASPSPAAGGSELLGVTALSRTDVWAVGESRHNNGVQDSLTMQWNGSTWTTVPSPNGDRTTTPLGATSLPGGIVWAVGGTEFPGKCCLRTLVLQTTNG